MLAELWAPWTPGLVAAALTSGSCAALALLLAWPWRARVAAAGARGRTHRWWLTASALPIGVAVAVGSLRLVAIALIAAGMLLGGARLVESRRSQKVQAATATRVLECCEQLAADLAAGQPPGAALTRAAEEWSLLTPVAEAFRVGSDVPQAWRTVARAPGAGGLRLVAAAWQVAHRTGEGLTDACTVVATDLRAGQATARIVAGELASARATARLVAGLPILALVMGTSTGGDPWGFLFGEPVGLACLAAGLGIGLVGLLWIEALARDVTATS